MARETPCRRTIRTIVVVLVLFLTTGPRISVRRFLDNPQRMLDVQAANLVCPVTLRFGKGSAFNDFAPVLPCESEFTTLEFSKAGTRVWLEWAPIPSHSFVVHLDRLRSPPQFV